MDLFHHRLTLRAFPLVLAALFAVSFGVFIPQFGLFWDDWVQVLSRHLYGYGAYFRYFYERPLSGWTHIVFGPLMGDSRLGWQIYTLGLRWGCVLVAWWLFQSIWPRCRREAALAALVFAVYPGFTQQPISVAYSQHWLQYLLFLLSLAFMVQSYRRPARRLLFLTAALACQVGQFTITEFFAGVELIRPVLLWIVLRDRAVDSEARPRFRGQLWRVLRAWAPYLGIYLAFILWRAFFFNVSAGSRYVPSLLGDLRGHPLSTLTALAGDAVTDIWFVLVSTWQRVFATPEAGWKSASNLFSWGIALAAAVGLGLYLTRLPDPEGEAEPSRRKVFLGWIGAGVLGTLIGPAPLWATGQNILDSFQGDAPHADRFTLAAMLWASLLLVGILSWAIRAWRPRALLIAALVGVLAGFQVRVGNSYRWESIDQSQFYWQLSWRAPAVQPGTAFINETVLFPFQGLFATSGAINLLYPQQPDPQKVGYWVYTLLPTLQNHDPAVEAVRLHTQLRLFTFDAQTPDSLVIAYNAFQANCLWVLRPDDEDYPDLSAPVKKWLPASNLARIGAQAAATGYPSPDLFGQEPSRGGWCYYFEKADLARQFSDWKTAADLGGQALAAGFQPDRSGSNAVYEWMPFLEADIRSGRWQEAASLAHAVLQNHPRYASFVCVRWQRWSASQPASGARSQADQSVRQSVCQVLK